MRINKETQRISLGMKQLMADPWEGVAAKYPVGATFEGRVTNIAEYGAFVELESGVEGLVHVSEMSWTKKNVHPGKILSTSQQVEIMILDVDADKRRISLGVKQTQRNPWEIFAESNPSGTSIKGEVKNITEFGLFVGLEGDIDGMVHLSDISWDRAGDEAINDFKKGDMVDAKVLDVDIEKERVSLGIKQLAGDPMESTGANRGDTVTCTVTEVTSGGLEVTFGDDKAVKCFIRKSDLSVIGPSSAQNVLPSVRRLMPASPISTRQHVVFPCPSRHWKLPTNAKPLNSMAPPMPAHHWAISSVLRCRKTKVTLTRTSPHRPLQKHVETAGAHAPAVFSCG
ncbi:MAG: S1 RNA-binding domain-containing protein [Opitutaceae bacterium]|nr:S1 RNA-binding domain-containing protein [Opitutaceae bacterium]